MQEAEPASPAQQPDPAEAQPQRPTELLTPREDAVLRLAAAGLDERAIAERLHLSQRTVRAYMTTAVSKLGVHGRAATLRAAQHAGVERAEAEQGAEQTSTGR
ncbi:response regulator transcription factor [Streptomyces sp. NPDC001537]